jgi:hypothetical protein
VTEGLVHTTNQVTKLLREILFWNIFRDFRPEIPEKMMKEMYT